LRFSIPLMSPPNLIVQQKIVPELQQEEVNSVNIARESVQLLSDTQKCSSIIEAYKKMRALLGTEGVCDRTAKEIINLRKI